MYSVSKLCKILVKNWHFNPIRGIYAFIKFYTQSTPLTKRNTQKFLMEFTYYYGVSPISFNPETNSFQISDETPLDLYCFHLGMFAYFITIAVLAVDLIKTILFSDNEIKKDFYLVYPLFCKTFSVAASLLHIHTALKYREVCEMLNLFYFYFSKLRGK